MEAEELIQRYEAGERDFSGVVIEKQFLGLLKVDLPESIPISPANWQLYDRMGPKRV